MDKIADLTMEMQHASYLVYTVRNQSEMARRLAHAFRQKYEKKKIESVLYKMQLDNLNRQMRDAAVRKLEKK